MSTTPEYEQRRRIKIEQRRRIKIEQDRLSTEARITRHDDLAPRAWTGYRVGPESGLTREEYVALQRTGQLEVTR